MKITGMIVVFALLTVGAFAQKKAQDREAIKAMCGCFEIQFDYKETFAADITYEFHDPYHAEAAAELATLVEDSEGKIVIQHLLVINDSMVIKHWRQDWLFQNQELYAFKGDRYWNRKKYAADQIQGQWTQKVYQVDDSPRYEGSATWVHLDGQDYWLSTTDAPLPRREYSKRSDYNIMKRTNKHLVTDYGWLHEQDNLKVIREKGKTDSVIVAEKGLNKYTRIDDSKCAAGQKWWNENQAYWSIVREVWDEVYAENDEILMAKKVDNKRLWQFLFKIGDEQQEMAAKSPKKVKKLVHEAIDSFLMDPAEQANAASGH